MSGRGGPSGRGAPGGSRGRGGKFKKAKRGGGRHYSRNLRPLDADGNEIDMWNQGGPKGDDDDDEDEDDEDEDDSDEDSEDEPGKKEELSREERKAQKAAQKKAAIAKKNKATVQVGDMPSDSDEEESEDDDMPANPNHSKAARKQTQAPVTTEEVDEAAEGVKKLSTKPTAGMSRRERESVEAAQAKERYRKLHEAGKTDEAKADMARLRLIREKRDAEAARRQAEKEERDEQESVKKAEIEAKEAKKREAALGKTATKKVKGK